MEFHITIKTKHVLVILLFITTASAIGLVVGYGTFNPSTFGHSWGEVDCDTNLCVNTATGRVGIGTPSPGKKLDINGFLRTGGIDLNYPNPQLGFNRNIETGAIYNSQKAYQLGISGDDFYFGKYSSSGAGEGIPISIQGSTGNVGIGTTNPGYKLDVNGNARVTDFYLTDGVQIEGLSGRNYFRDTEGAGNLRVGAAWGMPGIYAESGVGVLGGIGGASLQNNALFVTTGGNVGIGIGTTNPGAKLDVSGNIHSTGDICTDQGGGKCLSNQATGVGPVVYSCPNLVQGCGQNWDTCVGQLQLASTCTYCVPASGSFTAPCTPVGHLTP